MHMHLRCTLAARSRCCPLYLIVLNRDSNRGYENPDEGLFVEGGTSQELTVL